jgi:hypothetical protein
VLELWFETSWYSGKVGSSTPSRQNEPGERPDARKRLAEYLNREPVLVVGSAAKSSRWKNFLAVGTVMAWLAYYGGAIARDHRVGAPWAFGGTTVHIAALGVIAVALFLGQRYVRRRVGFASFYEDRVVLVKNIRGKALERAVVSFGELEGYRDDSAEFVQLIKKGERVPSAILGVPTSTEDERVKVLALLDRKGVRRIGD